MTNMLSEFDHWQELQLNKPRFAVLDDFKNILESIKLEAQVILPHESMPAPALAAAGAASEAASNLLPAFGRSLPCAVLPALSSVPVHLLLHQLSPCVCIVFFCGGDM